MKSHDVRALSGGDREDHLRSLRARYAEILESVRTGKEKNHALLKVVRRDMARALTIEREQQANAGMSGATGSQTKQQ